MLKAFVLLLIVPSAAFLSNKLKGSHLFFKQKNVMCKMTREHDIFVKNGQSPLTIASDYRDLLKTASIGREDDKLGEAALHLACSQNQADMVEFLLKQGAVGINIRDKKGQTPLMIACYNGFMKVAEKLIEAGANINIPNKQGKSPLLIACEVKKYDVAMLIARHPSIKDLDGTNESGQTALHLACIHNQPKMVELLLKKGSAGINIRDKKGQTPLMIACGYGYEKLAKRLIEGGADVSVPNKSGQTALHVACIHNQPNMVELLLKKGSAGINIRDKKGQTPLMIACGYGYEKLAKRLIEGGADVSVPNKEGKLPLLIACRRMNYGMATLIARQPSIKNLDATNENGQTALHLACIHNQADLVELLLKQGAGINFRDGKGQTPLMIACDRDTEEVSAKLIEAGADLNALDLKGKSPLVIACGRRNFGIAMKIASHPSIKDLDVTDGHRKTALHLACIHDEPDMVELLLKKGSTGINKFDKNRRTPLMIACGRGHKEVAVKLIEAGADINSLPIKNQKSTYSEPDEGAALHLASFHDHPDIVDLLLKQEATDINIRDKKGQTPLMIACDHGFMTVATKLIEAGADINTPNESGEIALHLASINNRYDIVDLLLNQGATDINIRDKNGQTPLMIACDHGFMTVAMKLIEGGADINILNKKGKSSLLVACEVKKYDVAMLIASQPSIMNLDATDEHGETALHLACIHDRPDMVELLLKQGAVGINIKDKKGQTPLHKACENRHEKLASKLIAAGADINTSDENGKSPFLIACENGAYEVAIMIASHPLVKNLDVTNERGEKALHLACKYNRGDIVELLLKLGADKNIRDKSGRTPLMTACEYRRNKVIEILIEADADINLPNTEGKSHLLIACEERRYEVAMLFARQPSIKNLDATNERGETALHLACIHDRPDMVELLLNQGAGINFRDGKGQTPLMIACDHGFMKVAEKFIEAGANIDTFDVDGLTLISKACENDRCNTVDVVIMACPQLLYAVDSQGQTALHMACTHNSTNIAELLLRLGADINIRDKNGRTAFSIACDHGFTNIMKLLVKAGCDIASLR